MIKEVAKTYVFEANTSFKSCHASHLALLPGGDILAVWFAGSEEGADDVAIWCARKHNGSWSAPYRLADEEGLPHWNPVLFVKQDGEIVLYYKVGRLIKEWSTRYKISRDNGFTWSEPLELVEGDRGGRGAVRNKQIVLTNGTWLAPASTENGIWKAFVDSSSDQGDSWVRSQDIGIGSFDENSSIEEVTDSNIPVSTQSFYGRGVIQPTLWESEPGKVHMLLRSSEGRIYRSDSSDYGRTWNDAYPTQLPNNNSGIDLVKMDNGTLVLAYNPVETNWGPRTPLVLACSNDNGASWGNELVLVEGEGEYSYPAILSDGNDIYVTYTWKRENIAFVQCSL
ncbi:sialidase family protein [Paenibacillus radicis (ex Xue et al. 2023)]|uniref:Exo-alpha-sialidase n=1 Tax=Paenibacillus radicis (ex Xue et al. 2023) TaxID=2972489 RepID=A0ABT1YB69_9BACL|nr:sialidase family protein [Paenibacillus radicis (ex Xue et al. 2023)]MCR8629654.1 exo-alpha-sialidase [Paenibacillus radicis (ex Xue et al. 2023)]